MSPDNSFGLQCLTGIFSVTISRSLGIRKVGSGWAATRVRDLRPDPGTDLLPDPPQALRNERARALLQDAMAAPQSNTGGIPLEEFRKDVPPGWAPGLQQYPLRLYFQKLKLWYRLCDLQDELVGPLIAGRLQGRAQRIALELRLPRPDGQVDVGDAALVRLSVDQVLDPADNTTVIQAYIPSGVQALCNALRSAFGESEEVMTTKSLESFFELRRTSTQDMQEYDAEWTLRYEEANQRADLEINNVAKTFLWLKQSGLNTKQQDDLRLQIQGDMSRFNDLMTLALRMSHRQKSEPTGDIFYEDSPEHPPGFGTYDEDGIYWGEATWDENNWWHADEYEDYYEEPYEDYWQDYEDHEYEDESDWPSPEAAPAEKEVESATTDTGTYNMGKGKGKGLFGGGCYICGSKWHRAADCPVGKQSGGMTSPAYTKGKGKGKHGGKGKNKGKYKSKKGYGGYGRKGSWGSYGKSRPGPRYYADVDHRMQHQMRHASEGLQLSPPKAENVKAVKIDDAKTEYFSIDKEAELKTPMSHFEELLVRSKKVVAEVTTEPASSSSADGAPVVKNLTFFFRQNDTATPGTSTPTTMYGSNDAALVEIFHTVAGKRRRGLIIDPGAANGLIGSETLRDLLTHCDEAEQVCQNLLRVEKKSEVTGISGSADTTLGEVRVPLPMLPGLKDACYVADVIGGEAKAAVRPLSETHHWSKWER